MFRPLGAREGIVLHHQYGFFAHRLLVFERQAERGEKHAHRELGRKVRDIVEFPPPPQTLRGGARDLADRLGEAFEIAAGEGLLDQAAQPVVARRIGGAERRPGAAGQLGHHVAVGGRIGLPFRAGAHDVVVARKHPHPGLFAPEAGEFVAQAPVERERVGVHGAGIGVEGEGHAGPP